MQHQLLSNAPRNLGIWQALALGASTLAVALNGYAAYAGKPQRAHGALRAAQQAVPEAPSADHATRGEPGPRASSSNGGALARQLLIQRLHGAPPEELASVAETLATLGDAEAREALRQAARSPRLALRAAAFAALATLDSPDVREFMVSALSEPEPLSAVSYFSDCREPRALAALERLAATGSAQIRRAAIDALFAQGTSSEPAVARLLGGDSELMDALLETAQLSFGARRALHRASVARLRAGAISGGRVFDFLEGDLSSEAGEALVLAARDRASVESATSTLVKRGDSASLAALARLANDSDRWLAMRAGCALASDPDSRSRVPLLRAGHGDLQSAAAAALVHINAPGARPI